MAGFYRPADVDDQRGVIYLDVASYIKSQVSDQDVFSPAPSKTECFQQREATIEHSNISTSVRSQLRALQKIERVLVVDDDEAFRNSFCQALVGQGCDVTARGNKDDATAAIATGDADFDLAFIDVALSGGAMDLQGLDVARELQTTLPNCRIVMISGVDLDRSDPRLAGVELSIAAFLSKPFGDQELYRALSGLGNESMPLLNALPGGDISEDVGRDRPDRKTIRHELNRVAEDIAKAVSAEAVVLFSLHPVSGTVGEALEIYRVTAPRP